MNTLKIVQKQLHENPHIFSKSQVNHPLVNGWNILKFKSHNQPNKCGLICDGCSLVPIFGSYFNLTITKNPLKKEYISCGVTIFKTSSINGRVYRFFLVATFSFWKSTWQILFFFDTMTINDNQEAFSIGTMNPTTNSLSKSFSLLLCNSSSFNT